MTLNAQTDHSHRRHGKIRHFFKQTRILWLFLAMSSVLAVCNPVFLSTQNLINILKQISFTGILGVGMTLVIISGGIDLSVGAIMAMSGVVAAYFAGVDSSMPLAVPIVMALMAGSFFGWLNGVGVSYGRFPPFIITLSAMLAVRGLALLITNGRPIFNLSEPFINIANGFLLGLPHLILFLIAVWFIGQFVLKKTVFGTWVYAIGGNEAAARLSGINVKRIKMLIYTLNGFLAGLCGLLMASRITSGNATVANGYELNAIAAVIIGGTSMSGGVGSLWGTLIGALFIGVIQNAFDILGLSPFWQQIMQGLIIAVAVGIDVRSKSPRS